MKPLFECKTICTYDTYRALCGAVNRYMRRGWRFLVLAVEAGFLITAFVDLFIGRQLSFYGRIALVGAVLFPLILWWELNRVVKGAWRTNQSMQNCEMQYSFYEDRVEQESVLGHSVFMYDKLYRILETKDYFFLMIGNNQGIIIQKREAGTELQQFLRELS